MSDYIVSVIRMDDDSIRVDVRKGKNYCKDTLLTLTEQQAALALLAHAELLAAAEEVVNHYEPHDFKSKKFAALKAAIAKAKGES